MTPDISIILPTYNRAWCIERAIKSVLNQSFKKWELIIVDDGSTDDTKNIIKKYTKDGRIKYFHQKNSGVNSARNYGIKQSVGKYLVFLDSDDELYTNKALGIIKDDFDTATDKTGVILYPVLTTTNNVYKKNNKFDHKKYLINANDYICDRSKATGENLATAKRKVFRKYKFPEYVNGFESLLWTKLILKVNFLYHNTPLRKYYIHDKSLSRETPSINKALSFTKAYQVYIRNNRAVWLKNNKSIVGKNYLYLSYYFLLSNKRKKTIINLFKSFRYNYINYLSLVILISIPLSRKSIIIINYIKNVTQNYR